MRRIVLSKRKLTLSEDTLGFFKKKITKYGNGAKVNCPKEFLGKEAYVVILKK